MMAPRRHLEIAEHYERCFIAHGDSHRGVDWPNSQDAETRYQVMLDVARPTTDGFRLLDVGCGAGHLYEYICRRNLPIKYCGTDISPVFVDVCQRKFADVQFFQCDAIESAHLLPESDYAVLNGVLTEKLSLSHSEMFTFMSELLARIFERVQIGLAFNVMSKHVDWERADLFHVPYDDMARFLRTSLSRHFVFRADYGLYEYTTYVYKQG